MMLPESHIPPFGREVCVRVNYLDGCGFLWLQLQDLDDEFERLYVHLGQGLETSEPDALLVSGAFVAAQHSDGLWHRAQLLSSAADNNSAVRVRFVDFGNEQSLSPQSIRPLPPKLRRPPAFALKCHLRGCPQLSQQTLDTYLNTFTPDRATFYSPDTNGYPIELSSSKPTSINAMLSGACRSVQPISFPISPIGSQSLQMMDDGNASLMKQMEQETVADAMQKVSWPAPTSRVAKDSVEQMPPFPVVVDPHRVTVDVVTCSGVDHFNLCPSNQSSLRSHLIRSCHQSVLQSLNPFSSLNFQRRPCAAWDNWLNKYVRCEMLKTIGTKCLLLAVDFGHSFEVNSEDLLELPNEFSKTHKMAIPCKLLLPNQTDKSKLEFDDETREKFKEELEECDAVFEGKEEASGKYLVSMINEKNENNMIEWLKNQNLLPRDKVNVKNLSPRDETKQGKVGKNSVSNPSRPPVALFQNAIKDISPQKQKLTTFEPNSGCGDSHSNNSSEDAAQFWKAGMFEVKKLAQVEPLDEWEPRTEIGKELEVQLSSVVSPAEFKLTVADGAAHSNICRMLSCLKDQPQQLRNIEPGVCCLFMDENERQRVRVTAVHSDRSVDVFCVDTGKTYNSVPRRLLVLNSSRRVRNAPCLSFSARLDAPENTSWSPSAHKMFLQTAACAQGKVFAKIESIESTGVRVVRLRSETTDVSGLVMLANGDQS